MNRARSKQETNCRDFTKLVGKVTDKEGNGMYYEVRGKDQQSCEKQFHTVLSGKPFFVSKLKVQKKNQYYAYLYADPSEKNTRMQFHAMASSHPSSMQMNKVFSSGQIRFVGLEALGPGSEESGHHRQSCRHERTGAAKSCQSRSVHEGRI